MPKLDTLDLSVPHPNHVDSLHELGACLIPAPPALGPMSGYCARFFDLPVTEKLRSRSAHGTLGYRAFGLENLALDAGSAEDSPPDRNESFAATLQCIVDDSTSGKFRWPDLPRFRQTWRHFHLECAAAGDRLVRLLVGEHAASAPSASAHLTRAVRYQPTDPGDEGLGAGEHTDFGWFTFIWANRDGLEICAREKWSLARIPANHFLVILGDVAALATEHRLHAVSHRVAVPQDVRDAVVFFYNPEKSSVIRPPDLTFETWLTSRDTRQRLRK